MQNHEQSRYHVLGMRINRHILARGKTYRFGMGKGFRMRGTPPDTPTATRYTHRRNLY